MIENSSEAVFSDSAVSARSRLDTDDANTCAFLGERENSFRMSAPVSHRSRVDTRTSLFSSSSHAQISISEADPGRVFMGEKARTKDKAGSGLGLSIAKWIVDTHGGQVEAKSTLGKGTTMEAEFPKIMQI